MDCSNNASVLIFACLFMSGHIAAIAEDLVTFGTGVILFVVFGPDMRHQMFLLGV